MLPKDLGKIIEAYNENGEYFIFAGIIYWFDGKRIEEWCLSDHLYGDYGNRGYCRNFVFIGCNFENLLTKTSLRWRIKTNQWKHMHLPPLEIEQPRICYQNKWVYYSYNNKHHFNVYSVEGCTELYPVESCTELPQKQYCYYGFKMIILDSFIYYFSNRKNGYNEKFNIINNEWTLIATNPNYIENIILFRKIIYIIFINGEISIYNPNSDVFLKTILNLHQIKYNQFDIDTICWW